MSTDRPTPARPRLDSVATISYISGVALLAVALAAVGYAVSGPPHDWLAVAVLASLGITSWVLRETDVGSRVQLSFISIVLLASAVIVGPVGAAIVGAVGTLLQLDRQQFIVRLFNMSLFSAMGSLGGLVYAQAGGIQAFAGSESAGTILISVGVPLIVADVTQCLLNAILIAGVLRASSGTRVRTQILKLLSTSGLAYIGYGVIGFLFVVLWIPAGVGWFSAILVLAPLAVAQWAFGQYGEELRAHDRTLRALVTAEEKKDPTNAGHSQKVAQLSEWLAEALGLGHKEIQDVRTAGMLHDIGKVGVPARYIRSRRPLEDEDFVVIAEHAGAGVELVRGIEFLSGSLDGIAHHHERYDGLGYPAGLAGEQIPLVARIVAVADVFDALTTERSYRPALGVEDALQVMRDRAGTHLDPLVVDALGKVLVRHPWQPTPRPDTSSTASLALDHDEPEVSDRLAVRQDLRERIHGVPDVQRPAQVTT
ncbi:HD-GYP domain-containing protein [Pedococcus sp. NPDC057267]|uniref:HD-GYP domain-containing protein n=1 Tax=Pedococcus sp. NPDC057267 TaxID=3346077 RepID=UPI003638DF84